MTYKDALKRVEWLNSLSDDHRRLVELRERVERADDSDALPLLAQLVEILLAGRLVDPPEVAE